MLAKEAQEARSCLTVLVTSLFDRFVQTRKEMVVKVCRHT
jgi:hypothetical protein